MLRGRYPLLEELHLLVLFVLLVSQQALFRLGGFSMDSFFKQGLAEQAQVRNHGSYGSGFASHFSQLALVQNPHLLLTVLRNNFWLFYDGLSVVRELSLVTRLSSGQAVVV